jgi:hypothetical protein
MVPFLDNQPLAPSSSKPGMMCTDLSFFLENWGLSDAGDLVNAALNQ